MKLRTVLILLGFMIAIVTLLVVMGDNLLHQKNDPNPNEETHIVMILNESNFQTQVLDSSQPVLIDFWATWCPPCNAMTPVVESVAKTLEGKAVVGKVNISEQEKLAKEYNISSIPAFIFLKNGEVQKTLVGVQSEATLIKELENLMDKEEE